MGLLSAADLFPDIMITDLLLKYIVCVLDGTYNACSKLYGACTRIARDMGYKRVITYTLLSECGTSLKASGFLCEGKAGGKTWTGQRKRDNGVPKEYKLRWAKYF